MASSGCKEAKEPWLAKGGHMTGSILGSTLKLDVLYRFEVPLPPQLSLMQYRDTQVLFYVFVILPFIVKRMQQMHLYKIQNIEPNPWHSPYHQHVYGEGGD